MATPYTPTTVNSGFGAETTINANLADIASAFTEVLNLVDSSANSMQVDLDMDSNDILNINSLTIQLTSFAVAGLPAASANTTVMLYVSDETGGAVPAFSDGTNWRRVTDRAIVS